MNFGSHGVARMERVKGGAGSYDVLSGMRGAL